MRHNSCEVLFIAAYVLHALFMSSLPSFLMQLRLRCTSVPFPCRVRLSFVLSVSGPLTVADGAHRVVVVHALADDPPLGEHGVGAEGAHVERAPGSQQVVGADVAIAASDGKVPVRQGKGGVAQHVLHTGDGIKEEGRCSGMDQYILSLHFHSPLFYFYYTTSLIFSFLCLFSPPLSSRIAPHSACLLPRLLPYSLPPSSLHKPQKPPLLPLFPLPSSLPSCPPLTCMSLSSCSRWNRCQVTKPGPSWEKSTPPKLACPGPRKVLLTE